ncbi:MAG: hypothetical protein FWG33_00875 [Oscillospiraceae bacterium]|nr:hypothetical protein [Oscillospiraceae bacterium]
MKKRLTLLILAAMCLTLSACTDLTTDIETPVNVETEIQGNDVTEPDESAATSGSLISPSSNGYVFNYNGYDIVLGSLADDLLEALGEPQNTFVEESCAFHGLDYMYFYPGVQFNTFSPKEGEPDYILSVVLKDDSVSTPESVFFGMTREEIEDIYGTPTETDDVRIQYIKDGMSLRFIFDDGELVDITYYYEAATEFEVVG